MTTRDNLSLFLVEDEALIAMDLESLVEEMGHAVLSVAANVEEAIDMLGALPAKPDAAIVDANLGGQSAQPIVEALKKSGIPTVIASGYAPVELERMGLRGVLVRKPYNARTIMNALNTVLAGG